MRDINDEEVTDDDLADFLTSIECTRSRSRIVDQITTETEEKKEGDKLTD